MANDYLISKWKLFFKVLDVKHEGKISKEGVTEDKTKFADLHHLEGERKIEMMDRVEKWWNEYILQGKPGPLTEEEFVILLNDAYSTDKEAFVKRMQACFQQAFEICNIRGGELLSEEDFMIGLRTAGHEQVALNKKFFESFKPVDSLVPVKDVVDSWAQFTTCEDGAIDDVVKSALESGV